MSRVTVAAFDFDGTLATRDSVVPFLRRIAGNARLARGLIARLHHVVPAAAGRDRDRLRSIATELALAGRPYDDVLRHAERFGSDLLRSGLRSDTLARLEWHRSAGHRVVLVSASHREYLDVVARGLSIDAVLATQVEVVGGVCTGRLDGANCRGPEKRARLHDWLGREGIERGRATIWAYGDSAGDRELLAMADHPVRAKRPIASVAPTE